MLSCTNCERNIGNLEQRYFYQGQLVCVECNVSLSSKTVAVCSVCGRPLAENECPECRLAAAATTTLYKRPRAKKPDQTIPIVIFVCVVLGLGLAVFALVHFWPKPAIPQNVSNPAETEQRLLEARFSKLISEANELNKNGKPEEAKRFFEHALRLANEPNATDAMKVKITGLTTAVSAIAASLAESRGLFGTHSIPATQPAGN
jgi:hypothetical protein